MKRILVAALLCTGAVPSQYEEWSHSGLLHVLTTPNGVALPASASVQDFPVLVRLHRDFFAFKQAADGGEDLRFASSDGEPLPYQIDEWDAVNGRAGIWVRLPRIRGDEVQAIRMYWGREGAVSESDGAKVFSADAGFAGVWHLDDSLRDATPNQLHGTDQGTAETLAVVGHGRRFAAGDYIDCGSEVDCLPAGNADRSMSAWINPSSYESGPTIGGWGKQGAQHLSYLTLSSRGRVLFHGYAADPYGVTKVPFGEWHHAMVSISGGVIRFFLDGQLDHTTRIRELDTLSPSGCYIGKHTPPGGRWSRHFLGMLDEVRFASVARSGDWARLSFENQRPMQRLVGPLVTGGEEFALSQDSLTIKEGGRHGFDAVIQGAQKVYWVLRQHGTERVVAVDRCRYDFHAGRCVMGDDVVLEVRAVYPDGLRVQRAAIRVDEAIPDPLFTMPPASGWDGRSRLEIRPQVLNAAALATSGGAELSYRWDLSGPAVLKRTDGAQLVLERAQGSGVLTVRLAIHNGGQEVVRTTTVAVTEPVLDPWVPREPRAEERPEDHQFIARDAQGQGTLYYHGKTDKDADTVQLSVFAGAELYKREERALSGDGSYRFSIRLDAGLVKYRTSLGTRSGGVYTELHSARDLVCGDAYIIQGQSNAEAFDMGRADHPYQSEWIRSFGSPHADPARARMKVWGKARGFERSQWRLQIGYWGMELARQLVERHKIPVFLINGAKGGTRIDQHQRDEADPTDVGTIYGRLLWRLREARLTHGIRGVFWHQGENDQGSAGPGGFWGWQTYERYFVAMAESWKRDYPNIQHYYLFQIMPRACSMGSEGSDDMLREVQRGLSRRFANLHVLSTLGIRPPGGCHYPPEGYAKIAQRLYPLVARDFHGHVPKESVTPPDLRSAAWTDTSKTSVALTFDQPVVWDGALAPRFHLDGAHDLVESGASTGGVLTLKLTDASQAQRITYLIGRRWNRKDPVLRGANKVAALTFCSVPIQEPPLSPRGRNRRGDALLKQGRFDEAIADFDAYINEEPRAEPHHWQRGIAYYYAGRYRDGVRQFEMHKGVNPNDVENAVWHFLCKAKLVGVVAARGALLPVGPDRRVPMMKVYDLFGGRAMPADVERDAAAASGPQAESALFYCHLYLGLYYEALGNMPAARHHIQLAASEHTSPHYMGDIARMHASRRGP